MQKTQKLLGTRQVECYGEAHSKLSHVTTVTMRLESLRWLTLFSPNSDQHQISPHHISAFWHIQVTKIKEAIPADKSKTTLMFVQVLPTAIQQNV